MAKRTARKKAPVIARDGNVNTLNSDMSTETLYTRPGANMGDQPFLMDVSERGHAEILDELTDLSANKGAYALREVYSNAHDATVKVGDMSRPIEITIPSIAWETDSLAEKLAMVGGPSEEDIRYAYVTDHGIGMTEYDLRTYFTQYGGSNKRDDAASIGSKGLGSKAPLAVADYFDVVTSKDGVKTSMHLWRAEDGNYAEVTGSEPCPADETGTTIKIPVMNPTIGKQMLECAEEIARYNSDAVVLVNGERTASTLLREVGSVSVIDGQSYVCVGDVEIGRDQAGRPVTVPVWLSCDVFEGRLSPLDGPSANMRSRLEVGDSGIRAILCGIGYQLVECNERRNYYYGYNSSKLCPTCIIEIEPGYLNFTVSRDEIKSDARKAAIVKALGDAIDALNLWPVAFRLHAHDFAGLRKLMEGKSLRKVGGKWVLTETFTDFAAGSSYVLTDADIEMLSDGEGRSMLPLLATFDGCDEDGHDARLVAWFSSAYNGKSARFHCAFADDDRDEQSADAGNWPRDLLSWRYGTDSHRGSEGTNSFSPNVAVIHDVVDNVLPYAQMASAVREGFDADWSLMVIGGVDAAAFSKAEHSIRRHVAAATGNTVLTEKVLYVLIDGPVSTEKGEAGCLSDAELALLDVMGGHVEVAMLDELARRCAKEDRARRKTDSSKTRHKGPKPLGTFLCTVVDIDESKFVDAAEVVAATGAHAGVPKVADRTLQDRLVDLDTLGKDDLVVIGCPEAAKVTIISMQAMLLQKMGRLDSRYGRIVFVPASHDGQNRSKGRALYAPQAKRLARQVTVLTDLREQWAVEGIRGAMSGLRFLTDDGVDIDKAGIEPDDDIAAAFAARSAGYIGAGGRWFLDNADVELGIARKVLALAGDGNRFASSVLAIQTEAVSAVALATWVRNVWSVMTAYSMASAIDNTDDPDIDFFVRTMVAGVIREATETYEKELAKVA